MAKLSTIREDTDVTGKGKFTYKRKKRMVNITIPFREETIESVSKRAMKCDMSRCEMFRWMVEFADKHKQFDLLMEEQE